MALKTLKDMPQLDCDCCSPDMNSHRYHLKAEAIKRVKNCNAELGGTTLLQCGDIKGNYCSACKRDIWFNNLTEEDLEDE